MAILFFICMAVFVFICMAVCFFILIVASNIAQKALIHFPRVQ